MRVLLFIYGFKYFLDCDSMVIDLIYWLIGAIGNLKYLTN
jgi:hypothetical protein